MSLVCILCGIHTKYLTNHENCDMGCNPLRAPIRPKFIEMGPIRPLTIKIPKSIFAISDLFSYFFYAIFAFRIQEERKIICCATFLFCGDTAGNLTHALFYGIIKGWPNYYNAQVLCGLYAPHPWKLGRIRFQSMKIYY